MRENWSAFQFEKEREPRDKTSLKGLGPHAESSGKFKVYKKFVRKMLEKVLFCLDLIASI
jgi:hypothetical protein